MMLSVLRFGLCLSIDGISAVGGALVDKGEKDLRPLP